MPSLGVIRGLDQCSSAGRRFTILAIDHRQNLRRDLRPADPAAVTGDELIDFKRSVVRTLGPIATGVLLDPEFGAGQAIADGSLPGSVGLVTALEITGYEGPPTDRRTRLLPDWSPERARRLGASAAKLLVYYHPDAAGAATQEELVRSVAIACHDVDLPLFLEPLTFSPRAGDPLAGEARRRAVIETARRLSATGVDVMKIEFPYDSSVDNEIRWQDACQELSANLAVPWILLSGGVDPVTFGRQVEVACAAGASGVAAGRAIWAEATGLSGRERADFLTGPASRRLRDLRDLVDRAARPWRQARVMA